MKVWVTSCKQLFCTRSISSDIFFYQTKMPNCHCQGLDMHIHAELRSEYNSRPRCDKITNYKPICNPYDNQRQIAAESQQTCRPVAVYVVVRRIVYV